MKYEFILMYLGDEIGRQVYDDYEAAQKFFYYEYFNYDRGCRVFVDNEELTIFEAYKYFNVLDLILNYKWHGQIRL